VKLVDEHHDPDPLIGMVIDWPNDHRVRVLSIEGEYDDDTTCVYVDGPYAGSQTMRDTFTVRRIAAQQRRNQASP
jgi:hypothetical protein